ncbi:PrgI family protein [Christensenellaceae bacterium OttesenSCG-928-K19]|nr:PrgI family protein [Christensenellaceae bacterium OttesenSCG-928-K19]
MAYVNVPNDLSKIKNKLAFNLTKRQLICFGIAAAIGVPTYIFTREAIGNMGAMLLMIGLMLPCFLFAMYERDGLPFEKVLRNIIRCKLLWPGIRPYKTENFYAYLNEMEETQIGKGKEITKHPRGTKAPTRPGKATRR